MEFAVLVWIVCGIAAAVVANGRGENGCLWFGCGVLLGPIGLLLAFTTGFKCPHCSSKISWKANVCPKCQAELSPCHGEEPSTKSCPFCAEEILAAAKKCKHCGEFLPVTAASAFCTSCGHPLAAGLAFCGECGKAVADNLTP
jgi:predicted amidophosphoribosyltransferase